MNARWIASYQGATTHSHSDRVVTARYSAFLFIFQFFIFSVLGVIVQIISKLVIEITGKKSIGVIYEYLKTIPDQLCVPSFTVPLTGTDVHLPQSEHLGHPIHLLVDSVPPPR
jgi:hypothetical protein